MAIPVRIVLEDASKAKLKNAISSLKKEIKKSLFQSNGVQGKLSKRYRQLLISNIKSQKYITLISNISTEKRTYGRAIEKRNQLSLFRSQQHVSRYKEWKSQYGIGRGKKDWWILFGDLLKNINTWKVDDGFKSGINATVKGSGGASWDGKGDKGKSKSIAMYARILEHRQPMFHPTLDEFIPIWQGEWHQALDNMGKAWK